MSVALWVLVVLVALGAGALLAVALARVLAERSRPPVRRVSGGKLVATKLPRGEPVRRTRPPPARGLSGRQLIEALNKKAPGTHQIIRDGARVRVLWELANGERIAGEGPTVPAAFAHLCERLGVAV